jgi:hypothetical protein
MSDAAPTPRDFIGDGADEELMFDEPIAADAAPVPSEAEIAKPRRVARRGRKSLGEDAPPEPAPAASMPSPSAEAEPATAEEPAGAPAPFPPLGAEPAGSKLQFWLLAIVAFAMLTSLVSLGGLIAVGRTLARAGADRDRLAAERTALAGVPQLVAHLDAASARLDDASARVVPGTTASAVGPAITMADLHHELDALKLALGQRQPEGLGSLNDMTRDGLSEMTTKLDRLSAQVDQMNKHGGAISASRPASRAGDPARPS